MHINNFSLEGVETRSTKYDNKKYLYYFDVGMGLYYFLSQRNCLCKTCKTSKLSQFTATSHQIHSRPFSNQAHNVSDKPQLWRIHDIIVVYFAGCFQVRWLSESGNKYFKPHQRIESNQRLAWRLCQDQGDSIAGINYISSRSQVNYHLLETVDWKTSVWSS